MAVTGRSGSGCGCNGGFKVSTHILTEEIDRERKRDRKLDRFIRAIHDWVHRAKRALERLLEDPEEGNERSGIVKKPKSEW